MKSLRYLSVCSGIGSDAVAWHPLGWETAAFAEIDKQASAVLQHHFPDIPNLGDFTTIKADEYGPVDLLAGGTPCQSFSVAGLRGGLDDDRGNLALEFCRLAERVQPRWVVWENVPGVLSLVDGGVRGSAFLSIVRALEELGYGVFWRVLDAQYIRVEPYARAVPQRRRRVFLVGYLGDWRPPVAVLLEPEGLRGNSPPRREAGQGAAGTLSSRASAGGGLGTDFEGGGGVVCADQAPPLTHNPYGDHESRDGLLIAGAVSAKWAKGTGGPAGDECYNLVTFDTTQITHPENRSNPQPGDPCPSLAPSAHAPAIAFSCKDHGADAGEVSPTLRAMPHDKSHANAGGQVAIAFDPRQDPSAHEEHTGTLDSKTPPFAVGVTVSAQSNGFAWERDVHPTVEAHPQSASSQRQKFVRSGMMVRRITPLEAERLMGLPDGWTAVPYRDKPMADGPRYRLIGNGIAINCLRWIGERIAMFERVARDEEAAA